MHHQKHRVQNLGIRMHLEHAPVLQNSTSAKNSGHLLRKSEKYKRKKTLKLSDLKNSEKIGKFGRNRKVLQHNIHSHLFTLILYKET